jgi:hypothetical protein
MELKTELKSQLNVLSDLLEQRGNKASLFFRELQKLVDLDMQECIKRLLPSSAISQYAAFTTQEEEVFDQLWNTCKKIADAKK